MYAKTKTALKLEDNQSSGTDYDTVVPWAWGEGCEGSGIVRKGKECFWSIEPLIIIYWSNSINAYTFICYHRGVTSFNESRIHHV